MGYLTKDEADLMSFVISKLLDKEDDETVQLAEKLNDLYLDIVPDEEDE